MSKSICFVTSSRADWGKMYPLIEAASDSGHECHVFCTGMHYRADLGYTALRVQQQCEEEGWAYLGWALDAHQMDRRILDVGVGFGGYCGANQWDLIVIHGDRAEALGAALTASLRGLRVAHVEGGEVSGTADEIVRHAITKLSHVHYVCSLSAKRTVEQLGERPDSIFRIGSPDLDVLIHGDLPTWQETKTRYAIPYESKNFGILLYHPISTYSREQQEAAAASVADFVKRTKKRFVWIYPNDDPGSDIVRSHIEEANRSRETPLKMREIPSMRFEHFLTMMKNSCVMVGNSSAGIREIPSVGLSAVNIGPRQTDREETNYAGIWHVDEGDSSQVAHATDALWGRDFKPSDHYGNGKSADKFAWSLTQKRLWDQPLQKKLVRGEEEK